VTAVSSVISVLRIVNLTLDAEIEVPPDLLKRRGVDNSRVCFYRLLLGIQHETHRTASRTECCRISSPRFARTIRQEMLLTQ